VVALIAYIGPEQLAIRARSRLEVVRMIHLDAILFASICIISSAAQERTEHWGDKRQVASGRPVDESLLNEKSQYGCSSLLLTWRRWRRSSIVGLTTSVNHGFQHPLLAGRRTAVARLEEAQSIAIVGSWGGF
jgi:hypothetical protein